MASEIGGRDGKGGMVHGVRSLGSATLDLAYCAMGSFDIWWEAVSFTFDAFICDKLTDCFRDAGSGMCVQEFVCLRKLVGSSQPPIRRKTSRLLSLSQLNWEADCTWPSALPVTMSTRAEEKDKNGQSATYGGECAA